MAGRGTDIKLGEGVAGRGGLFVIGTERHESRRIDRQLRGRCARQGDPGGSRFYVSFEDDLMRNFGAADRMTKSWSVSASKRARNSSHPWLNNRSRPRRNGGAAQLSRPETNPRFRRRDEHQREVVYTYRNDTIDSEEPRKTGLRSDRGSRSAKVRELLGRARRARSRTTPHS